MSIQDEPNHDTIEEEAEPPPRAPTPKPERPTHLATVEERLLRLQTDFTQLAPQPTNYDRRPVPVNRLGESDKKETPHPTSQVPPSG